MLEALIKHSKDKSASPMRGAKSELDFRGSPGSGEAEIYASTHSLVSKFTKDKKIFQKGAPQQRTLTHKQLRDMITDMYVQKAKHDAKCRENKLPVETME